MAARLQEAPHGVQEVITVAHRLLTVVPMITGPMITHRPGAVATGGHRPLLLTKTTFHRRPVIVPCHRRVEDRLLGGLLALL